MDLSGAPKAFKYNHWLPYWAVFQMDLAQTARSWTFRFYVLTFLLLSLGYLMHRWAIHHQAGIVQSAFVLMQELVQVAVIAGITMVIVLTSGAISSERGTMADSVLSRGISRYQYFLGKLHARLVLVVGSFLVIGLVVLTASCFLLQMDVSVIGSIVALVVAAAILGIVAACGVTISSLCNSTVLGIAILWMGVYGAGIALWFLEYGQLNPHRLYRLLPGLLAGQFDWTMQLRLVGWCAVISFVAAFVGLVHFARRDV